MVVTIWTTSSGTTGTLSEDVPVKEYYKGATFRPITVLERKLKEYCKTNLYVLLDNDKYVKGSDPSTIVANNKKDQAELNERFIKSTVESDVSVILLPSVSFNKLVKTNWDKIVERAKPNTIWCLGTSRGSLENIDIQKLKNKGCKIFVYERRGVAPIGTEIRDQLLEEIQSRVS